MAELKWKDPWRPSTVTTTHHKSNMKLKEEEIGLWSHSQLMTTPGKNLFPNPVPSGCPLACAIPSTGLFSWTDIFESSFD